jgi:predicted small lipoprotein YifL
VKLIPDLSRFALFSLAAMLLSGLSACGQTGPLYLPAKPAAVKAAEKNVPPPSPPQAAERAANAPATAPVPVSK